MARRRPGISSSDEAREPRYLVITESREYGYFHLKGRVTTQRFDQENQHGYLPYGIDDHYGDGPLFSGLRVSCQGDERSQLRGSEAGESGPVYGWHTLYEDYTPSIGLAAARRMVRTLEALDKALARIENQRGYCRSFAEYCGRVAEALHCDGIAVERKPGERRYDSARWDWYDIGSGVNAVHTRIWQWQQEAQPKPAARLELPAGEPEATEAEVQS
jgi:hypothetical protein